jgi:type II secretory ATPase GspE/PulE/Tfp pilus assembly ATPase PilB-like protein
VSFATAVNQKRVPLGELLRSMDLITEEELQAALAYKQERGVKLGQALVALHLVSESDLAAALRRQGKVHCINLTPGVVVEEIAQALGEERSRRFQAVAINRIAGVYTVALEDPTEVYTVDEISMHLKGPVFAVHAEPARIAACINRVFLHEDKSAGTSIDEIIDNADLAGASVTFEVGTSEDETPEEDLDKPVINMVRAVVEEAFEAGASDIHLEPGAHGLRVRFRVDGSLFDRVSLPRAWVRPVLARLKVLANLDIAERRLPQDGRAVAEIRGHKVDLRIATTPTLHGEGGVIRILDGGRELMNLEALDFDARQLEDIYRMTEGGEGIVLATGPTGSGKTTTLYACLKHLNAPDTKIITLEDPVENQLDGATQISTNAKIGLSFARGLRSILRQDPDIVLLGEVRDEETAQIAVQAALTGHLVLSTLHTVGAAESITRLEDMGLQPYLMADSLRGILAQRLVRKLCPNCRRPAKPDPDLNERLGLAPDAAGFFRSEGCDRCSGSGYKGRLGIYEVMRVTPELGQLIRRRSGADQLRQAAVEQGMCVLREDGIRKAREGRTSLEEINYATARG